MTILFVDDNPDLIDCYLEETRLAFPDFTILSAINGKEALKQIQQTPVDIVFTDEKMPVMSGLELAGHLKALSGGPLVFMISGYAGDISNEEIRKSGVIELIPKPVNFDALMNLIEEVARQINDSRATG